MAAVTHRVSVLSGVNYVPPTSSCKQASNQVIPIEHPIFKCYQVVASTDTTLIINIKPDNIWTKARASLLNIAIASKFIETVSLQPVHPSLPQILYMRHDFQTDIHQIEKTPVELELDDNPDQPYPFSIVLKGLLRPWPRFVSRIFQPDANLQLTGPIELKIDQPLPTLFLAPAASDTIKQILECFLKDTESQGMAITYTTLEKRTKRLLFQKVS